MSQQETIEQKWNEIFVDFLDQMAELFPESPASRLKMTFHMSKFLGGKKPIIVFLDHLDDHSKEIETEDEHYFFSGTRKIPFVDNLQLDVYYKKSSDDNRKIIWKYIKTLYQLSRVYNSFLH